MNNSESIIRGDIVRLKNPDSEVPFSCNNFVVEKVKPGGWYNISDGTTMLLNIPKRNLMKVERKHRSFEASNHV